MAILTTYFNDFISEIRLTSTQTEECNTGHTTLRERLHSDQKLAPIIVDSFLQGSYKRSTAIRPSDDKNKSDVDIIVVTNIDSTKYTPQKALALFEPFLKKYYDGKYEAQGRSWGIKLSYVEMDLVPTSAPSEITTELLKSASFSSNEDIENIHDWNLFSNIESEKADINKWGSLFVESAKSQWQNEPLLIPDREIKQWDETHPLAQINATSNKNKNCNGHFVNVVKGLKWWRTTQKPDPKYPKSYPFEHLMWLNCPDGIDSIAKGIVLTLEAIRDNYRTNAQNKTTPFIKDHGVPGHNVLGRVTGDDFAMFHALVEDAAKLARLAYDESDTRKSALLWGELFGDKFPEPPESKEGKKEGYSKREGPSIIGGGRFAL